MAHQQLTKLFWILTIASVHTITHLVPNVVQDSMSSVAPQMMRIRPAGVIAERQEGKASKNYNQEGNGNDDGSNHLLEVLISWKRT